MHLATRKSFVLPVALLAIMMSSNFGYSFSSRYIVEDAIIQLDPKELSRGNLNLVFHNTTPFPASITGLNSEFISSWEIIYPRKSTNLIKNITVPANATLFMKNDTPHFLLNGLVTLPNSQKDLELNLVINNDRQITIKAKIVQDTINSTSVNN